MRAVRSEPAQDAPAGRSHRARNLVPGTAPLGGSGLRHRTLLQGLDDGTDLPNRRQALHRIPGVELTEVSAEPRLPSVLAHHRLPFRPHRCPPRALTLLHVVAPVT